MISRRIAREIALQAIYQCAVRDEWTEQSLQPFFDLHTRDFFVAENESTRFCLILIRGVILQQKTLDLLISRVLQHWKFERLQKVDCAILRIALFELMFIPDVPLRVTINEAIELAHLYSGGKAPAFVNGVLDSLVGLNAHLPVMAAKLREQEIPAKQIA